MSMGWGKLRTSTLDSLVSLLGLASPFACGALWQLGCAVWQSWISLSLPLSFLPLLIFLYVALVHNVSAPLAVFCN